MQSVEGLSDTGAGELAEKCRGIQKNTAVVADELESIMNSIKFGIDPSLRKTVPVDICSMVPGYVQEFKALAEQKQIQILSQYSQDVRCFADLEINGFEKTLQNIMDNALKFAKSEITVSIYIEESVGSFVCIDVFDDGEPIPREHERQIFKRGWTSGNSAGHGLGLAFADEYLKNIGGSITLKRSEEGRGKSFVIKLPVAAVEQRPVSHDTLPVLFVVEDDNELRNYLKKMLSSDFSVIAISSYIEVLARLKEQQPPDIILMDRMLGTHDGIEILKQLKNTLRLPSLPLVFLSGLSETEKRMEALELGAADYITKPFQIEELRIRLRSIMHRDRIVIQSFKDRIMQMELLSKTEITWRHFPDPDLRMQFYKEKKLSNREVEIAEVIILMGNPTEKEIARELNIAIPTVKNHKSNIFRKLDIEKREDILTVLMVEAKRSNGRQSQEEE
jgi:DNA-binding NarL/FixJ family response regulator